MDPAIIFFGFGVGFLVGMTGMGGGSLMTPLLVLLFGIKPTTAIGTDIFYAAVTKTAGSWRHLKLKTVNMPLVYWMAAGSVPSAIAGVWFLDYLKRRLGDNLDETVFAILAGCLLVVGAATLLRGFFLADKIQERDDFEMHTRHKVAAVGIGATTGFVIGLSSAGSGTLIGIMLIAVYRLTPGRWSAPTSSMPPSCSGQRPSRTSSAATSTSGSPPTSWSARCPAWLSDRTSP